jgi:hypothetical protein
MRDSIWSPSRSASSSKKTSASVGSECVISRSPVRLRRQFIIDVGVKRPDIQRIVPAAPADGNMTTIPVPMTDPKLEKRLLKALNGRL